MFLPTDERQVMMSCVRQSGSTSLPFSGSWAAGDERANVAEFVQVGDVVHAWSLITSRRQRLRGSNGVRAGSAGRPALAPETRKPAAIACIRASDGGHVKFTCVGGSVGQPGIAYKRTCAVPSSTDPTPALGQHLRRRVAFLRQVHRIDPLGLVHAAGGHQESGDSGLVHSGSGISAKTWRRRSPQVPRIMRKYSLCSSMLAKCVTRSAPVS